MIDSEAYCREIEAYLCRKNDGHLIRVVGPAFEQVSAWAGEGVPLNVAFAGIDRYFERYYRQGRRRRPVRIEFCDADVRDAFDDWRRALGVATRTVAGDADDPGSSRGRRVSLARHIESALSRLTALRGSDNKATAAIHEALERASRELDAMQADARRARGEARDALIAQLDDVDRELLDAAVDAVPTDERAKLSADAEQELAPFRARMTQEAYGQSRQAAMRRSVRLRFEIPRITYD